MENGIYSLLNEDGVCIVISADKTLIVKSLGAVLNWNVALVQYWVDGEKQYSVSIRSFVLAHVLNS